MASQNIGGPYLAIMEPLILLVAPPTLASMVAVHNYAPRAAMNYGDIGVFGYAPAAPVVFLQEGTGRLYRGCASFK